MAASKPLSTPPKSYLTVADLYRMFHIKKKPHQTRITIFFKPVGNSLRNHLPTTKKALFSLSSLTPPNSHSNSGYRMRSLKIEASERYVSDLPLKMAPEKRFENILHTTSPTLERITTKCPDYYGKHTKCSACRRRHLEDL